MMSVRSCVAVVRCVFQDQNLQLCLWALVIVGFCAVREETKETPTAPYPHRKNVLGFEAPPSIIMPACFSGNPGKNKSQFRKFSSSIITALRSPCCPKATKKTDPRWPVRSIFHTRYLVYTSSKVAPHCLLYINVLLGIVSGSMRQKKKLSSLLV